MISIKKQNVLKTIQIKSFLNLDQDEQNQILEQERQDKAAMK